MRSHAGALHSQAPTAVQALLCDTIHIPCKGQKVCLQGRHSILRGDADVVVLGSGLISDQWELSSVGRLDNLVAGGAVAMTSHGGRSGRLMCRIKQRDKLTCQSIVPHMEQLGQVRRSLQ